MQEWIEAHPDMLVGTLGEGELEVKGDFAINSWGAAEYEEEDEEIEDVEMRLQSVEDWAIAMAFNDIWRMRWMRHRVWMRRRVRTVRWMDRRMSLPSLRSAASADSYTLSSLVG